MIFGHGLDDGFVLLKYVFFEAFEMLFSCLFVGDCQDVFVSLAECGEGEFCVGEGLADVADCSPVEVFLLFVFELHWWIDVEVFEDCHADGVAVFVYETVVAFDWIDFYFQVALVFRNFGHSGTAAEGYGS